MNNINHTFEIAKIESIVSKSKKTPRREKFIGYDLKIKAECDSTFLKALSHGTPPEYDDFFFEDDGTLKSTFISDFNISREISEHRLEINLDVVSDQKMIFLNIHVKQFKFIPVYGKLYVVKFIIHVEPSDEELLFLNQAVKHDHLIVTIMEPMQFTF